MKRLKIGVLELLADSVSQDRITSFYGARVRRHYASIMPQVVAVWCEQLGGDVTYATYYGQDEPRSLLPDQLDVVFISTYTHASATAYALAKLFRGEKTLTVIGGPHARSFPTDCLRFFDLVVHHCDKTLLEEILRGFYSPGMLITSGRTLTEIPGVEERLPYIVQSSLNAGRRSFGSNVPLLSSVGCPYTCDFCVDWSTPYIAVPPDQLEADLRFIAKKLPGVFISYHDPNFAVRFDQTLDVIETLPKKARSRYFMESSLSILKGPRLKRLKETNCFYAAPGVESWTDYSNKAGVGANVGREKLDRVIAHFNELHEYVPGLQANFIFGADTDEGDEPVEMTREFIRRVPFVWPAINIPTPFGNTPLYDRYLAEDRILRAMPFAFYYLPYMVMTPKNYHPVDYYDYLIRMYASANSLKLLGSRIASTPSASLKLLFFLRTLAYQGTLARLRRVRGRLKNDEEVRTFHEGRSRNLPAFYRRIYKKRLGRYAELISEAEMTPATETPCQPAAKPAPRARPSGVAAATAPAIALRSSVTDV